MEANIVVRLLVLLLIATSGYRAVAQTGSSESGDAVLDRALRTSMLTYDGRPFHAVMEIGPVAVGDHPSPGAAYTGRVEVWWAAMGSYRVVATSPSFTLQRVVNGGKVVEKDAGDFYPRWLQTFVDVLVDPVPVERFRESAGAEMSGGPGSGPSPGFSVQRTITHEDRVHGITNDLTYGRLFFDPSGKLVSGLRMLNEFYSLKDWQSFDGKMIAKTYDTYVLDTEWVEGSLTTLETLRPDDTARELASTDGFADPPVNTKLVSTLQEESMTEKAPSIVWPVVREGKTEGYIIVYARTDRSGQVREATQYSADNDALQAFGIRQALLYKFKPLIIDGVAVQMEMPLVLHFASHVENPTPVLTVDEMKPQVISCHPDAVPKEMLTGGEHAVVQVTVDESGKITNSQPISKAPWGRLINQWMSVKSCKFRPYLVNGKATVYKGDVELPVR